MSKKAERQAHTFQVGDIIKQSNLWGAHTKFYEVVKRSTYYVWLQQLDQDTHQRDANFEVTNPVPGTRHGEIRRCYAYCDQRQSSIMRFGPPRSGPWGYLWDGKPVIDIDPRSL